MSIVTLRTHIFFFFQAEDGIRDYKVTGVQTCALPIYDPQAEHAREEVAALGATTKLPDDDQPLTAGRVILAWSPWLIMAALLVFSRSEERRVGKEGRSRWSPYH